MKCYLVDTSVWINFLLHKKMHKQRRLAILRKIENNKRSGTICWAVSMGKYAMMRRWNLNWVFDVWLATISHNLRR